MTSALDVITFGEAMMLLVADRPGPLEGAQAFYKRTAGAETNVAIGYIEVLVLLSLSLFCSNI